MLTPAIAHQHERLQRAVFAEEMQRWGRQVIDPDITGHVPSLTARPYVARTLARVPEEVRPHLLTEYLERFTRQGEQDANSFLRDSVAELFQGETLNLSASDEDVRHLASIQAGKVSDLLGMAAPWSEMQVRALLLNICDRMGIAYPKAKTTTGMAFRMNTPKWWQGALRRQTLRRREEAAIRAGLVHSKAGMYVSDATHRRLSQKARRDRLFLEAWEMVNECGDVVDLVEVFEAGQSNPKHRYTEMMIRTKGMEEVAYELGWVGLWVTPTCPSRMHPRIEKTGARNPKFDGTTPRQAHDHLQTQWENSRAAMGRRGIEFMGVRVEEPHHDGTPHRHMLIFVPAGDEREVLAILREYYLERFDPDEQGARELRIKVERIDKAKGGAANYLAKYIAKNIGGIEAGQQLDLQAEGLEPGKAMPRPTVWARVHGVRQFDFFGTAKVTLWRELRRLRKAPPEPFLPHYLAADSGDWQAFVKAMAAAPLSLLIEERESLTYPGETVRFILGVQRDGHRLVTRQHTWVMRRKAGISDPWTRVNNCTRGGGGGPGNRPGGVGVGWKPPQLPPRV